MNNTDEFYECETMTSFDIYDSTESMMDRSCQGKNKRTHYTSYYFPDAKEFIENIKPWTFNNPLNPDHIESMYKQFEKSPILTGVFTVICLENQEVFLIDGHHRHQALYQLYQNDFDEPIEIEVQCFYSDTIDSQQTIDLFSKLNNTKPFKPILQFIVLSIEIIKKLKKLYPNVIRNSGNRVNFPNIHEETLNQLLQQKMKSLRIPTEDNIMRQIMEKNEYYRDNMEGILAKTRKRSLDTSIQKVEKLGCYLGIVDIKEWINSLV